MTIKSGTTFKVGAKLAVLLFVFAALFSGTAHAYQLSSFNLLIEDPATGTGRVLTDNVSLGFLNVNGDGSPTTAGTISFGGVLEGFNVTILATSTNGVLTLSANVVSSGAGQIVLAIEDTGYTAQAGTITFDSAVSGFDGSTKTLTPEAGLTGGASMVLQSWLDTANAEPAFGADSGSKTLSPNPLTAGSVPVNGTSTAAFDGSGQSFTTPGSYTAGSPDRTITFAGGNYSIFSQAAITFSGAGSANFTLTGSDPLPGGASVPEPTSLLLVGSALLGFGVIKKKRS